MQKRGERGDSKAILIVILAVVLAGGGFYVYKYFTGKAKNPLAGQTVQMEGYDIKYGMDGESATITDPKTGARMMTGSDLKVPSDFPKDIPVYKNGKIMVISLDPQLPLISFTTEDDPNTVQAWYRADLQKKGWTITASNTMGPDIAQVHFENRKDMGSVLMARDEEGKRTNVTLSTMNREEAEKDFGDTLRQPQDEETGGEE